MFHLDYLSCFLTVLATILLARKSWIGLLVAIVNGLIVCVILDCERHSLALFQRTVLHLRLRVQHAALAQGTNTGKSRSGAAKGIAGYAYT
jgi:pyruvate/2-oxoglutarate dehydrogenase complex dihydrolipoamide acyltransferase (E2) component